MVINKPKNFLKKNIKNINKNLGFFCLRGDNII